MVSKLSALLFIAATFAVVLAQPPPQQHFCDETVFQNAANQLGAVLNVPSSNLFNGFNLYNALQNAFVSSLDLSYVIQICNNLANFYSNLGHDNLYSCLGLQAWVNRGQTPQQAFHLDGTLNQYEFLCGTGIPVVSYNPTLNCVKSTWQTFNTTLFNALNAYIVNVNNHPENACAYGNNLTQTVANVFANNACQVGGNVESNSAKFWACAGTRKYVEVQHPHCARGIYCDQKWTWQIGGGTGGNAVELDFLNHP